MSDLTIGSLEEATGVPRRTIYFYVQQGILPPPSGAGLAARYGDAHLVRLRAIPHLRAMGWRLDRIRELFQRQTDAELATIVAGATPDGDARAPIVARLAEAPASAIRSPARLDRYRFAPGVDLFVEPDLPPSLAAAVDRLLDAAEAIFSHAGSASASRPAGGSPAAGLTDQESSADRTDGRSTEDAP